MNDLEQEVFLDGSGNVVVSGGGKETYELVNHGVWCRSNDRRVTSLSASLASGCVAIHGGHLQI